METSGIGLLFDMLGKIKKRQDRIIALLLSEIERVMDKDSKEYKIIRKLILDHINDLSRSIVRLLIGDVEGLVFR